MPDLLAALSVTACDGGSGGGGGGGGARWWLEAGFFSDAEDHLPLPEERTPHWPPPTTGSAAGGPSAFRPPAVFECTDESIGGLALGAPAAAAAEAPLAVGRHLDVIAP